MHIRSAASRGEVNMGWLNSHHTFSFGSYQDPRYMGVSHLRVINEDRVQPAQGFATHSHRNMEILTYVVTGTIEHQDSMDHRQQLIAGQFQLMSAGHGVTHSEYNASERELLHFMQIWILPNEHETTPRYQERARSDEAWQLIAAPDNDAAMFIRQDVRVYHGQLQDTQLAPVSLASERTGYLHLVTGKLQVNAHSLNAGDGLTIQGATELQITSPEQADFIFFDLAKEKSHS